ncbi:unnamed protein product [Bursaphelenchus xylophilus]|uniref:(pine wood nematode) hypothetical protein n=1 Tax=Bursaphelenchus xylophilus TaxID=6326 RepID=A0A1I7RQZ1_BURXY|nr:unnamed protein product [Bursaphelenchus xylophilus]CAG9130759.1 unnamed protein product [Bursaphelenchus xylophilus]
MSCEHQFVISAHSSSDFQLFGKFGGLMATSLVRVLAPILLIPPGLNKIYVIAAVRLRSFLGFQVSKSLNVGMKTSFLVWLLASYMASADVTLFISKTEMNRTLGVLAEMNYVENGIVNAYSTKFPYRVAANISHLVFTWFSPSHADYSVQVHAEDFNVLPIINIPTHGKIPRERETFSIEYRCAGSRAGQFLVTLFLNITTSNQPLTFSLKQEKICVLKDGRRATGGSNDHDYNNLSLNGDSYSVLPSPVLLYSTAAILICIVLLTIGAVCFYNRSKSKPSRLYESRHGRSTPSSFPTKESSAFDSPSQPFLQPCTSTPLTKASTAKLTKLENSIEPKVIFERKTTLDVNKTLVELYADRNLFQVMPFIEMEGKFGEIRWAIWRQNQVGLSGDIDDEEDGVNEEVAVICKTLKNTTDRSHFEKFIRETLVFHQVPAQMNLAQVQGAATFGHFNNPASVTDFPLICYRHQGFGFLKKFLLTCRGVQGLRESSEVSASSSKRSAGGAANQTLRTHDLVNMTQQILKAISHLHKFGVIHKDVATRNCLIAEIPALGMNERLMVQLCDSALSRDLYPEDYYSPKGDDTDSRPVKWMAPETIRSNVYNSSSDVWSFGVFMWELFTCGQQPFVDCNPEEIPSILQTGTRLGQPYNCPDEMYSIMYSCWNQAPLERPTTSQLQQNVDEFAQQLRRYI